RDDDRRVRRLNVVDLHGVGAEPYQQLAVGAEGDEVAGAVGVLASPELRLVAPFLDHLGIFPQAHLSLAHACPEDLAVRSAGEVRDNLAEVADLAAKHSRRHVPEADRAVVAARGEVLAVRTEGKTGEVVSFADEGADILAGARVPQAHIAVAAPGGDELPIGAE